MKPPSNILIINFKYLGDLIVCTPAIRAIRKSFPGSKITLLARKEYSSVLRGNPNLDEIIWFDSAAKKLQGFKKILAELNFIKLLRKKKFDCVISLQSGDRYTQWAYLTGANKRVGPQKQKLNFLLTDKVFVFEDTISYREYYLRIAESAGAIRVGDYLEYYPDKELEEWKSEFLKSNSLEETSGIIAIHPGASEPTKIWPLGKYLEVINQLLAKGDRKIILLVGPAEKQLVDKNLLASNKNIVLCDTSDNIHKLGAILEKSKLLICNDSGVRHLAAALKIKTITLFPEDKIDSWKFYTDEEKQYFIVGKRNLDDPANSYLDGINVSEVIQKAEELLNDK